MVRLRYWRRGYGRMPYPPNLCASVPICGRLSLPECSVCSACSVGHSLPVCLFGSVVVFSHGFHRFPQMVRLRYWRRGYGRMPYPPNLCVSVPICGRLSLPEGSVCSACSVGHSPHLLCWCCRGSCASVVVFSHGFHGFPQMVRLCYWRRGYGILPYPPNQCASVSICGRHFSARRFCVFRVFCGTLSLFALLVHLWAAYLRWFPSAARSDSVRHPIRFRSPPDQIPFAIRSDCVRCTMP